MKLCRISSLCVAHGRAISGGSVDTSVASESPE
jgi:hypothetical protein